MTSTSLRSLRSGTGRSWARQLHVEYSLGDSHCAGGSTRRGNQSEGKCSLARVSEISFTVTVPEPPKPKIARQVFRVAGSRAFSKYSALVPLPSPISRVPTNAGTANPTEVLSQLLPAIEIARTPARSSSTATRPPMGNVVPAFQGDPSTVALKMRCLAAMVCWPQ